MNQITLRGFLKSSLTGGVEVAVLPNLVPGSLFGATTPSKRIQVAHIGCSREAARHE